MDIEIEDGSSVNRRAVIDTSAPFRSVKEAVMLFGEQALAGDLHANKFKEEAVNNHEHNFSTLTSELEKSRQCLDNAREENQRLQTSVSFLREELEKTKLELQKLKCRESEKKVHDLEIKRLDFSSLHEELEKTKLELQQLKSRESEKEVHNSEIEHLKFIENMAEIKVEEIKINEGVEFQMKRSLSVVDPPLLIREGQLLDWQVSMDRETTGKNKKKKKPFISLIEKIFFKQRNI